MEVTFVTTSASTGASRKTRQVSIISLLIHCVGFFIACVVAGLEYIHERNIIHRDIKPENLVLEDDGINDIHLFLEGYVRVTDFGIARVWRPDNAQDTSGTPGYMGNLLLQVQPYSS